MEYLAPKTIIIFSGKSNGLLTCNGKAGTPAKPVLLWISRGLSLRVISAFARIWLDLSQARSESAAEFAFA
jgi:hypothetical protein